jgi:hypothetical protein
MIGSWAEMKPAIDALAKQVQKIPAPPNPDDSWGEKMNSLTRTTHTLQEHVNSKIEAEDAVRAREEDE